ncbi:hypothetical protein [Paenibacillus aestuarii]|uniref:Uncharacterized protein n=1 Tax=Paenibacillus aestuarii TaxID=516965 RepID=A0ABW0KH84_9BACL|nr:hypothetical protein [Paenibacillus aestuarii]
MRRGVRVKIGAARTRTNAADGKKVLIYHDVPNSLNVKLERRAYDSIILNTVWETSRTPRNWLADMNKFDAVCVPSQQTDMRHMRMRDGLSPGSCNTKKD